jgi:acyl carrier protein
MNDTASLFEEIRQFIGEILDIESGGITHESPITELSEDSIQLFELLIAFEKKYALQVAYEEIAYILWATSLPTLTGGWVDSEYHMHLFRVASTEDEWNDARTLVHRIYVREGYIDPESSRALIGEYIGKNTTTTFLGYMGDALVGTISVAEDASGGLPMDQIFRDEVDTLREEGKVIGEVCQFAIDDALVALHTTTGSSRNDLSLKFFGCVLTHARERGITHYCFSVNPKHARFYELIGSERIGDEKQYPSVNMAPALAYVLDIEALLNREHKNFLEQALVASIL